MKLEDLVSIDQLVDFLSGTQAVAFSVLSDKDVTTGRPTDWAIP